jgi:cell division protein FtsI/penicillin-binding protein 2
MFAINKKKAEEHYNGRMHALAFMFFAIIGILFFRFYALQFVQHSQYQALANGQHSFFKNLIPERGEIFMKDKKGLYPAAVNQETKMAYAVPTEIENPQEAAFAVAEILQMDVVELKNKFEKTDDVYEPLKHRLNNDEIDRINNSKLKGVHLSDESFRYYPSGELAANVIGFVGWKDNSLGGRYGLESYFDEELKGKKGSIFQQRDAFGGWIGMGNRDFSEAKNGDTVFLTIDHIVQYQTERILKNAVSKYGAEGGSILVMEPETGKILSMASSPSFNPNEYAKVENIDHFRNTTVNDAYEPGSILKPFTIAAGLDSDKITPDSTYTDTGAVTEAGYTIKNSDLKSNGLQTMTEVLEKSLNTGVIYVEKLIGNKNFADYIERFGFGEKTGIELIGEASGNISNLKNLKSNIQFFTASFGQGVTVTPIQLAAAYGSIANGGTLMKPQIVDKIVHPDGAEEIIAPREVRRVISQKSAMQTAQILRSVVVNGHGKRADVPGFLVGGKTGTAQVVDVESKGYSEDKFTGSFAGFAPINDPKFTIIVKLDTPKNVEWAESSAAPAFGELMKFLLEYYNIEPTEDYTQKDLEAFNQSHNLTQFKKEEDDVDDITTNPEIEEKEKTN